MQTKRVIDFRSYSLVLEIPAESVSPSVAYPNNVLIPHVAPFDGHFGQDNVPFQAGFQKKRRVTSGDFLATGHPLFQMTKFDQQGRRLEGVHPTVDPNHAMIISRMHSMNTENPKLLAELAVVGGQHSAVAHSAQILGGIEAQTSNPPQRSNTSSAVLRADGLGGVLHDGDPEAFR